jgi:MFS family permease
VSSSFWNLFKRPYAKRLLAGWVVNIGQQLSGINFFILYSCIVFEELSIGEGRFYSLIISLVNFFGVFVAVYLITRYGRRPALLYGIMGQAIFYWFYLLAIHYENNFWIYFIASGMMLSFSIGLGSTYLTWVGEILPPVGVGFCLSWQWFFTGIVGYLVPMLLEDWGHLGHPGHRQEGRAVIQYMMWAFCVMC